MMISKPVRTACIAGVVIVGSAASLFAEVGRATRLGGSAKHYLPPGDECYDIIGNGGLVAGEVADEIHKRIRYRKKCYYIEDNFGGEVQYRVITHSTPTAKEGGVVIYRLLYSDSESTKAAALVAWESLNATARTVRDKKLREDLLTMIRRGQDEKRLTWHYRIRTSRGYGDHNPPSAGVFIPGYKYGARHGDKKYAEQVKRVEDTIKAYKVKIEEMNRVQPGREAKFVTH